MHNRRDVLVGSAAGLAMTGLSGCGNDDRYADAIAALRAPLGADPDLHSFIRYATLAANGHNTQPWRFARTRAGVDILPDYSRRTPVVDPDDHHLFVSLGCAAENLSIAARPAGDQLMSVSILQAPVGSLLSWPTVGRVTSHSAARYRRVSRRDRYTTEAPSRSRI
jgi:hypothetical protein